MGTPEFSIPALQNLINSQHKILAVYTREPKPAGRGQKIQKTPIHILAEKNKLKIFTPKSLRQIEEQEKLRELKPDIIVVVAYGLILPKEVLEIPKYGCVNIHPSLLPRWRGGKSYAKSLACRR
jgi:methionyl-tRNA formyltransferase